MRKDIQTELENMEAFFLLSQKQENTQPFHVPDNYFQDVKERLIQVSEKRQQFQVPEGYFEQLNQKLVDKIDALEETQSPKRESKKVINLRPYLTVAASLAVLISAFFILNNNSSDTSIAYQDLYEEGSISAIELAYVTDDAESYVLESLFNDFDANKSAESVAPLYDDLDGQDLFEDLFNVDDLEEVS